MLLRMRDFVTLNLKAAENKKHLFECKDSKEESGHKLLVTVAATHSGVVNGNMRFYRPDMMAASIPSWTPKGRIPLPNLLHHDKHGQCVGRVMKARYVDLSADYVGVHADLKNNFFCDSRGGRRMNIYDSVDWIVENLQDKLEDYVGLGYTELGIKVTDPDAIRRVMDGEFMGVSVGFGTDSGVCSICRTDWAKDSQCEHKIGKRYGASGKLAYLITGKHINKEISWVNFPADVAARVLNTKSLADIADSLEAKFFWMGLPLRQQANMLHEEVLQAADSLACLDSDIELVTEEEMEQINIDELVAKSKSELVKDSALELRSTMGALNLDELDPEGKRRVKRALVNLDSVIRKNGWSDVVTKDSVEARIASVAEVLPTLTDNAARAEYIAKLEADAKAFGLDFTPPALEDAKPEPAAAEGADAQAETPAVDKPGATASDAVKDLTSGLKFVDSEAGKSYVAALEALEKAGTDIPDGERWDATEALFALWEKVTKTNRLEMIKKWLQKEECKDMLVSKDEWAQVHDELTVLDTDVKKLEGDNKVLLAANARLLTDQKHTLATQLVLGRVFAGDPAVKKLSADGLKDEIAKKAGRNLASLTDAVSDLMDTLPVLMKDATRNETAAEPTPAAPAAENKDSQAAETAKEIKDDASIQAKEEPGNVTDSVEDGTSQEAVPVINYPIPRKDLLKRMAIKRHQQLKS